MLRLDIICRETLLAEITPTLLAAGNRTPGGARRDRLCIDHIGSTTVPGLVAKPVIDIQISVAAFKPVDAYRLPLKDLGYHFRPENPDRSKRYFREAPGEWRTHIHVRRWGSWAEQFALLFRDYLQVYPDDAERYAKVKVSLAEKYGEERVAYTESKTPIIWEIMQNADRWSKETGWESGPSDA